MSSGDSQGRTGHGARQPLVVAKAGVDLDALESRDTIPPTSGLVRPTEALPALPMATPGPSAALATIPPPSAPRRRDEADTADDDHPLPVADPGVEPAPEPEPEPEPAPDEPVVENAPAGSPLASLEPAERRLLACAAVIGDRFWFTSLRALFLVDSPETSGEDWAIARVDAQVNALLARLQKRRVVTLSERSSLRSDIEFAFVDPADRSELRRQLAGGVAERLHRALAEWMEGLPLETRVRWHAPRAYHLAQGRRPEAAARAYLEAARAKASGGRHAEALLVLDQAIALVDLDAPRELADVQLERAGLLAVVGRNDDAIAATRAAVRAALVLGDQTTGGRALLVRAEVELPQSGVGRAASRLELARATLDQAGDDEGRALAAVLEGAIHLARCAPGDLGRAVTALERAIGSEFALRGPSSTRVRLAALPVLADVHLVAGNGRVADELLRDARQLAERARAPVPALIAERVAGDLDWARGREGNAIERWKRALTRAREMDIAPEVVRLHLRLGEAEAARGGPERARADLKAARDAAEALGAPLLLAEASRAWARVAGAEGELHLARATGLADKHGAGRLRAACTLAAVELAAANPDHRAGAAAALRTLVAELEAVGQRALLARALVRLATLSEPAEATALRARAQAIAAAL